MVSFIASRDKPKEMAIKFYVLFAHSLSVASDGCCHQKNTNTNAKYDSNRHGAHSKFGTLQIFISLFLLILCVCVCVCFYFLWLKVKFSTRALALYVGYDVFTFVAMPLHSEERSKFETANKMMMSCWWCIHTSAHKRISILWAVSRLLLLTMNCKTMVFATTRSYTTTALHRHRHRHSRAVVVRYYKLFTNLYLLKPE